MAGDGLIDLPGNIFRVSHAESSVDLRRATRDFSHNDRRSANPAINNNREAFLEVLPRYFRKLPGAAFGKGDFNLRLAKTVRIRPGGFQSVLVSAGAKPRHRFKILTLEFCKTRFPQVDRL